MVKFIGETIGKIVVLDKSERDKHIMASASHYRVKCLVCNNYQDVQYRDLMDYKSRFKNGCYSCSGFRGKPKKKGWKYGKNVNGFIDKTVIIYE